MRLWVNKTLPGYLIILHENFSAMSPDVEVLINSLL